MQSGTRISFEKNQLGHIFQVSRASMFAWRKEGDYMPQLLAYLKNNPLITLFDGSSGWFRDEEVEALLRITTLIAFILCKGSEVGPKNEMGRKSIQALAENKTITMLGLTNSLKNTALVDSCIAALAHHTTIKTLNLSCNPIGDQNIKTLVENNKVITTLALEKLNPKRLTRKGPPRMITLESFKALAASRTLTALKIGRNGAENEAAKRLARSQSITMLSLYNSKIEAEGAAVLAQNEVLKTLDLSHNPVADEGVKAFINNKTLTTLIIDSARGVTVESIAPLMRAPTALTTLSLHYLRLGPSGAEKLAIALEANHTLTRLDISWNRLGNQGAKLLAVCQNPHLIALHVAGNGLTNEGAECLAKNPFFTTLNVADNEIGHEGAEAFANNHTLTVLDISVNAIGVEGVKALGLSKTLTDLNVSGNKAIPSNVRYVLEEKNPEIVATLAAIEKNKTVYTLYRHIYEEEQDKLLLDVFGSLPCFPLVLCNIFQDYMGEASPPIPIPRQYEKAIKESSLFQKATEGDRQALLERIGLFKKPASKKSKKRKAVNGLQEQSESHKERVNII